jgi:hypothetical protein
VLPRLLGTPVRIPVARGERGRIEIPFYSGEDFERVVDVHLGSMEAEGV